MMQAGKDDVEVNRHRCGDVMVKGKKTQIKNISYVKYQNFYGIFYTILI